MMTIIRARTALLQNTDFRFMPASLPGAQGYYQALYYDSTHEESLLRTTAEMLEDKDRENRALHMELFHTRSDHWATLTRFALVVQAGYMDMRDLYPVRSGLPDCMEWRDVGGITPPRGPRLWDQGHIRVPMVRWLCRTVCSQIIMFPSRPWWQLL